MTKKVRKHNPHKWVQSLTAVLICYRRSDFCGLSASFRYTLIFKPLHVILILSYLPIWITLCKKDSCRNRLFYRAPIGFIFSQCKIQEIIDLWVVIQFTGGSNEDL